MQWRWFRAIRLVGVLAALCVALVSALVVAPGAPVARAAGVGPCSPLTPADLAQPQVTAKGNAWAALSRTQGTDGTALSLSGGGWTANTQIGMDIWADYSGTFRGDPIQIRNSGSPIIPLQGTTSASGALQFPTFRLPSNGGGLCGTGMSANGHPLSSVAMLVVVHTLDGNYSQGNVRRPIQFTFLAPPTISSVKQGTMGYWTDRQVHVGDTMTVYGSGWAPGEQLTVTPQEASWPNVTGWWSGSNVPVTVPTSKDDFTVVADSAGKLTFTYTIPQVAPLTNIALLVHGSDARYGDISLYHVTTYYVMPVALPGFKLDHDTVTPGGAVTVTGFNWQPGQQGTIEYCRGVTWDGSGKLDCASDATQALGTFQADSAGAFVIRVRLPGNARLGDITLQARVNDADLRFRDSDISAALAWAMAMKIEMPSTSAVHPTWAQIHPRQAWLIANAPYLGGGAAVLLAALVGLALYLRRRRGGAGTQTA